LLRRSETPLDGVYCNALLFAHWSVRRKLNRVNSVPFSYTLRRYRLIAIAWHETEDGQLRNYIELDLRNLN